MRYVPGVGFIHQQPYTTTEENKLVCYPQRQEKTSIPSAPTTAYRYNFCKGEGHYLSICEANCKTDIDLKYRIMPATNIVKIYLDLEDGPKEDPDFYLAAHVDNDNRMQDVYIALIKICPM